MNEPTAAPARCRRFPGTLQARIVVFFGLMTVVVQLFGLVLTYSVGTSNANNAATAHLATGERVFNELVNQRTAQLAQGARVLAADYAFRTALASHDDETIASALANHGARIGAQVMMLVGLDRRIVADSASDRAGGRRFPLPALIATAEKARLASAIVMLDGHLSQVVVVPVAAPLPVGWVVMGFAFGDSVLDELQKVAGLEVTFAARGDDGRWTVAASTLPAGLRPALDANLRRPGWQDRDDMRLDDEPYAMRTSRPTAAGDEPLLVVLQIARAEALAPFRRLMNELMVVAAVGLLVSIACSVAIARGIARPVRQLATYARRIATGDFGNPPDIQRIDEIGDLSAAFGHMREGIASRERRITELAYRDELTGLPNRALFSDRLQQAIATSRRMKSPLSVLVLDLDRFADVNDTLGHAIGDLLLRQVAERLTRTMRRETDTVARLGGDEFALLLPTADLDAAQRIVQEIVRALEEPMTLDGHVVDVHASIGIANFPEHGDDLESLLRRADVAMYSAKRNNTGHAVYDIEHDRHSAARLSLMGELRRAVEHDQLVLLYQPKVGLSKASTQCVEALLRWQHPTRGFVPPDQFIPFSEQTGYIRTITMWVLEHAVAQSARWQREGLPIEVSINLSARDLPNPELPGRLAEMLGRHGARAESLWLEITESAILEDTRHAVDNLDRLAALGCKLSIDDYGTGYSSLSYLKRLPVDELKIDRSFVTGMMTSRDDRIIVQSTIDLAHNMGLTVTAEGVEDQATLDRLRAMGCDMAQGFLMSRPIAAGAVLGWMRDSPWATPPQAEPMRLTG